MNLNLLISRMQDVGNDLKSALAKWERAYEALDAMSDTNPSLKDKRGKLTEAGRERMTDMLASGKTNAEIAEFFSISSAAVSYHRR